MKKSVNFDLDIKKLEQYHPNKNSTQAYADIKKFMLENNFEHRQGSGYISQQEMSNVDVVEIIEKLNYKHNWLLNCCKVIDCYSVEKEYNLLEAISIKALEQDKTSRDRQKKPKLKTNFQPRNRDKDKNRESENLRFEKDIER